MFELGEPVVDVRPGPPAKSRNIDFREAAPRTQLRRLASDPFHVERLNGLRPQLSANDKLDDFGFDLLPAIPFHDMNSE
jgi:hypothetical protein